MRGNSFSRYPPTNATLVGGRGVGLTEKPKANNDVVLGAKQKRHPMGFGKWTAKPDLHFGAQTRRIELRPVSVSGGEPNRCCSDQVKDAQLLVALELTANNDRFTSPKISQLLSVEDNP